MQAIVDHLARENLEEMVQGSYLNCHAKGLHSLMLLSSPGKTIRMFYATRTHDLWKNAPDLRATEAMSIAVHPHRRNLTLATLFGTMFNVRYRYARPARAPVYLDEFRYQSKIVDGDIGFKRERQRVPFETADVERVYAGQGAVMASRDLHTVFVPKGTAAAWFVLEGRQDPEYADICYSNADLESAVFDGFYEKPTEADVVNILRECGVFL